MVARQLLIDQGLGSDEGQAWPVKVSSEPELPDNAITIYDLTGQNEREMATGTLLGPQNLQLRVRGTKYPVAWTKLDDIVNALLQVENALVTVDGVLYIVTCFCTFGSPNSLGKVADAKRNVLTLTLSISCKEK